MVVDDVGAGGVRREARPGSGAVSRERGGRVETQGAPRDFGVGSAGPGAADVSAQRGDRNLRRTGKTGGARVRIDVERRGPGPGAALAAFRRYYLFLDGRILRSGEVAGSRPTGVAGVRARGGAAAERQVG